MGRPYAVVTFLDDVPDDPDSEITSEVPSSWVTRDEQYCWWPSAMKNVTILISKQTQPNPSDEKWQLCKIKLHAYYDNLEAARKRAQSLSSSEEDVEATTSRGKRNKRKVPSPPPTDSSKSSGDVPLEKRRTGVIPPPNYEAQVEDEVDNLMSITNMEIAFANAAGELHLGSTSTAGLTSGSTVMESRSRAVANDTILFDALLPITSDTTDPMMISQLSSSLLTDTVEKLPFESLGASTLDTTGTPTNFNRNPSIMGTPTRPLNELRRSITGLTTRPSDLLQRYGENTNKVLRGIGTIVIELQKFNRRLEKLEGSTVTPLSVQNPVNSPDLDALPFSTTDQIRAFEAKLFNRERHPQLISHLMNFLLRIGGNNLKDNTT